MDRSAVAAAYDRQADTVYRICYAYMKNAADAEDMVQETFLRLIGHRPDSKPGTRKSLADCHRLQSVQKPAALLVAAQHLTGRGDARQK